MNTPQNIKVASASRLLFTCFSTVFSLTKRLWAMALLERPSTMSARTSRSRSVKRSSGLQEDRGRPISWLTTSGSRTDPPRPIRSTLDESSAKSETRSFKR